MIAVGTQGWNYEAWVGPFYPSRTRSDAFLSLYAEIFETVEVDSTFYATPSEATVRGWIERTPPGFTFALKMPRAVTHERRLRGAGDDVALFCDRARLLGPRLACVLVQLPPDLSPRELPALEALLPLLPTDIRFAVEFRDRGWLLEEVLDLLERFGVAATLADSEWLPRELVFEVARRTTADFAYVRWLGSRAVTDHTHVQIERDDELAEWAQIVTDVASRVEAVFAYFSNFYQGHAPASASHFRRLVGQSPRDPSVLVKQPSLF